MCALSCVPQVTLFESPYHPGMVMCVRSAEERRARPDRVNLDRRQLAVCLRLWSTVKLDSFQFVLPCIPRNRIFHLHHPNLFWSPPLLPSSPSDYIWQSCPVVEGEPGLKLLNLQHNHISHIDHLYVFRNLIFLDLFDNQIECISGLEAVPTLRVLMLGRNRIRVIENLHHTPHLDVLDLHANRIEEACGLSVLKELRVLNLASNNLTRMDEISTMPALTELNVRRNKVVEK